MGPDSPCGTRTERKSGKKETLVQPAEYGRAREHILFIFF